MAIKSISMEEAEKLPKMTDKRIKEIEQFEDKDYEDCKPLSAEQIADLKPARLLHPEWYRPTKTMVNLRIDTDVLEAFKSQGKGYQTRINEVLRRYVFG